MTKRLAELDLSALALDLALILSIAGVFLSYEIVIWFHIAFLLVVIMSFQHNLRPLLSRAVPAGAAVFTGLLLAVRRDDLPSEELIELPILSVVILLVYFTVSRRERLTDEVEAQKNTIDEIHRASQRELQDQLLLTQRLQINDRLNATVAHDVNNILSAMQLAAETLSDGNLDGERVAHTGRELEECVQRAGGILGDLVGAARITNRVTPQPPADLIRVMNSITPVLRRVCGDDIELFVEHEGTNAQLGIPRLRLEQILVNLTINAIDAAPDDDAFVRITTRVDGDLAVLTVVDNGHGMSKEVAERIYEPLFTTKTVGAGSGLGLFAAREFVEDASGTISVRSAPGRGTTFELTIPVIDHAEETIKAPSTTPMSPSARRLALRILVADDDHSIREMVSEGLRAAGHNVMTAVDGEAAQNLIESADQPFDMLILDAMMPGTSGLDLVQRLAISRPELPILLMSGYAQLRPEPQSSMQVVRFRQKPFTMSDMLTDLQMMAAERAAGSSGSSR